MVDFPITVCFLYLEYVYNYGHAHCKRIRRYRLLSKYLFHFGSVDWSNSRPQHHCTLLLLKRNADPQFVRTHVHTAVCESHRTHGATAIPHKRPIVRNPLIHCLLSYTHLAFWKLWASVVLCSKRIEWYIYVCFIFFCRFYCVHVKQIHLFYFGKMYSNHLHYYAVK